MTDATARAGVWATFKESPAAVKTILLGIFINRLGAFLNIFLTLFMVSKGYSASKAALALGVYGGGAVVGSLIGGALNDKLGARTATMVSMAGSAALTASLLYLPNYPALLVAVVAVGVVSQLYRPASSALMSELTPDDRQVMIFALYRFGLNLGTMAAPLIGLGLYHLNGEHYTAVFWVEALIALGYALLAWVALPGGRREQAGDTAGGSAPTGSYLDVLRDRKYVFYLVATLVNGIVYMQYLSTLPLDVTASKVSTFWYAFAVSLNGFMVIAFELQLTKFSQNWPFRVTVPLAFTLVGLGMATYGLPLGPAVIIVGTLIWTIAEIIGGPSGFAYPAVAAPPNLKGRYIGSFQFVFGLGTALGPIVGGSLFAAVGHTVWPIIGACALIAVVCGLIGIVEPKKSTPATPTSDEPVREPEVVIAEGA